MCARHGLWLAERHVVRWSERPIGRGRRFNLEQDWAINAKELKAGALPTRWPRTLLDLQPRPNRHGPPLA
jgi:hypothetical protein